ncbi:MAG: alpha/beta hydrolase [Robiginitomaculum sp.]|nr:alpha/beta hydrolase [Robiginitomaculum sp.]MDQ7078194.1 alpha/beta hydrolase [Robiginitomaculum sp.]
MASTRFDFTGYDGAGLAALLEMPEGEVRATALFAHCFTCSKDILAARLIARTLANAGFAVLRFDFTGLGNSEGEFANTNFSSNIMDLRLAALALAERVSTPDLLIGHSLGGAAVLAAAKYLPDVKAIATIGAPSDPAHVLHNMQTSLGDIEQKGEAMVTLAGRSFLVQKQFLEDVRTQNLDEAILNLKRALLVLHAPADRVVGIENAAHIFALAKHPKSYVSLDDADHLLIQPNDAQYVANVITAWVSRYL